MEEEYTVSLKIVYTDSTTRTLSLSGVEASNLANVKTKVKAINASMPVNFAKTFVSNNGASAARIDEAKIIAVTEEVIYNAG